MQLSDIFFDLDHTLWDFDRNSQLAFASIFDRRGMAVNLDDFLGHYIPLNKAYWEKYRQDLISQEQLRYGRLRDSFDHLGYAVSDSAIDEISCEYIETLTNFNHLFDGAVDVLQYLQNNYRLHIITNGFQSVQERKLANSGLKPFFATVTNSEHCGVKKPNPLIFEYALRVSGSRPERSLMVGDCIDADVRGALNCGMQAVWFSNQQCPDDIRRITDLRELKKIL